MSADISEMELSSHVALLLAQLDGFNLERPTRKWADALQTAQQAEEHSTTKIFLEKGNITVWFAYFVTKRATEQATHFSGKAECTNMIADLEKRPIEYRESLAKMLADSIKPNHEEKVSQIHDMIKQLRIDNMSHKPKKRRRPADDSGTLLATSMDLTTATSNSAAAHHFSPDHSPSEESQVHSSCDSLAEENHVMVTASLVESTRLFPSYLSGAIRRVPDPSNGNTLAAAIAMTFPNAPVTNKFGCQMTLEISANKVEHFALNFFIAHLETTAGLRYLCLPGGAKALPNPKCTLRGCRYDVISPWFGPETSSAIMASPGYQDDVRQGYECTDCISMVISQGANDTAFIFVSLGSRGGILIKDKLYN